MARAAIALSAVGYAGCAGEPPRVAEDAELAADGPGVLGMNDGSGASGGEEGGGQQSSTCSHDICLEGEALDPSCDSCVAQICGADSFCCDNSWDSYCLEEVSSVCGQSCEEGGGDEPPPTSCAHDACSIGEALDASCSDCAAAVCGIDPFCCEDSWDAYCVQKVPSLCGEPCGGGGGPSSCSHGLCETGEKLDESCSPCVAMICGVDAFCCKNSWDEYCVEEVSTMCDLTCAGENEPSVCPHDPCSPGEKLDPSCGDCETQICAVDPFCCGNSWDSYCIQEVSSVCGLSCE